MTKNYGKYTLILLVLIAPLTGCGPTPTDRSAELAKLNLPTVKNYEQRTLRKVSTQIKTRSLSESAVQMLIDYGIMRDEVRVLHGEEVDALR